VFGFQKMDEYNKSGWMEVYAVSERMTAKKRISPTVAVPKASTAPG
jgi:hypothetical protein